MLVLSRAVGTSLFIGEAEVKILDMGKGRVKIGIEAPAEIKIWRSELKGFTRKPKEDTIELSGRAIDPANNPN